MLSGSQLFTVHGCVLVLEVLVNNDKFCTLFSKQHHEAGQDKIFALSGFYSCCFSFIFPAKRKPTFKPSYLLFL